MNKNIIKEIREIQKYSDNISFKIIAEFILDNAEQLNKYTIFDISKKTATSASTITRFCKKIGLQGFKGLPELITDNLRHRQILESQDKDIYEQIGHLNKFYFVTTKSIENTHINNELAIKRAVELLKKSADTFLYTKGGNIFLAHLFVQWSMRVNKKAFFSSDSDQQKAYTKIMTKNDVAIIISYSLESEYCETIVKNLNDKDISKIFITKNINSKLITSKDVILEIGENESTIEGRSSGEISTLFLLKALFLGLLDKKNEGKLIETDIKY